MRIDYHEGDAAVEFLEAEGLYATLWQRTFRPGRRKPGKALFTSIVVPGPEIGIIATMLIFDPEKSMHGRVSVSVLHHLGEMTEPEFIELANRKIKDAYERLPNGANLQVFQSFIPPNPPGDPTKN